MNISKKWSAAAAGLLTLALVGSGAAAANAAPGDVINPQPNGSPGSFFIWDGNTGTYRDGGGTEVYGRDEPLLIAGNSTNIGSEIPVPAGAAGFTQVYRFIAKTSQLSGGKNTWQAYDTSLALGPTGGLVYDSFTFGAKPEGNAGGIEKVFTDGGDWVAGVAFTTNNGVTPLASLYRTIHVNATTDTITVDPVALEIDTTVAPLVTTQPASVAVEAPAGAVFTAAASGTPAPTVQWESSIDGTTWTNVSGATNATLTVSPTSVGQSGTQYRAKFTNSKGSATTNGAQLTVTNAVVKPVAGDPNMKVIATPVDGKVSIADVPAGTYTAYAWSTPTNLGTVVVPASGVATITVPAVLQDGAEHTFALLQADNSIVSWGSVIVPLTPEGPLTSETQLNAQVTVSGKFALEGVNAGPVALGTAKRGATTTPVALGAFTVTDDRDLLKGWTLNASVATFKNANLDEIPGTALGVAAKKVGDAVDGVSVSPWKSAGDPWTSTLIAEGAVGSYTPEVGTQFDADLTFKAPANAKKGTYNSTLTLTLASK